MTTTGMGSHHSAHAGSNCWLTPPGILAALGKFTLDPCAAPDPRPWSTAREHIAPPDDGLTADWTGHRVWLNAPYSDLPRWLGKLADHAAAGDTDGIALVFVRVETHWWNELVWARADAIQFLHRRLTFRRPDGTPARGNAGAASALVAYGDRAAWDLQRADLGGAFTFRHNIIRKATGT